MYLCKFDSAGKRTETLLEGVHYKASEEAQKIADGYVSVSDDDYAYYVGNHGNGDNGTGYVRGTDGKPVSAPTRVVTKEEKAATISSEYSAQIAELKDALATATLAGDADLIASLKTDYATTMTAYQAALKGAE